MANDPKEAERQGHPFGYELAGAKRREGVDSKVSSAKTFERAKGHGKSVQPFSTVTESRVGEYSGIDLKAHPPGGRLLLEDAEIGVHPLISGMVVRG
ncbi:hypothetical protein [Silvibacterium acidisoli]|uniref:hypothetical protein n=1 Tax=Acidobacteriaceae bacterium ZG23-2 TaxID=2883246 RepID=UPI00406D3F94